MIRAERPTLAEAEADERACSKPEISPELLAQFNQWWDEAHITKEKT